MRRHSFGATRRLPALAGSCLALLASVTIAGAESAERGTSEATLRGRKVTIEYGRPRLLGRTLDDLIAMLPEDRVWRAGINDVTSLVTEVPLRVGGRRVAPGRYSVYVHAPKTGPWSLILNADPGVKLGTWGAAIGVPIDPSDRERLWPHLEGYDTGNSGKGLTPVARQEVARVALAPGTTRAAVEAFTISLGEVSGGLVVTLAWGERTWAADLKAED